FRCGSTWDAKRPIFDDGASDRHHSTNAVDPALATIAWLDRTRWARVCFYRSDPVDDHDVIPGRREDVSAYDRVDSLGVASRELSERAFARCVRTLLPQQRRRVLRRHDRQSRLLYACGLRARQVSLSVRETHSPPHPLHADAAAGGDAGTDVSRDPQVRLAQQLS